MKTAQWIGFSVNRLSGSGASSTDSLAEPRRDTATQRHQREHPNLPLGYEQMYAHLGRVSRTFFVTLAILPGLPFINRSLPLNSAHPRTLPSASARSSPSLTPVRWTCSFSASPSRLPPGGLGPGPAPTAAEREPQTETLFRFHTVRQGACKRGLPPPPRQCRNTM